MFCSRENFCFVNYLYLFECKGRCNRDMLSPRLMASVEVTTGFFIIAAAIQMDLY